MIQQVNLYQNLAKPKLAKPDVNHYLYGLALIILLMLGFSIFSLVQMKSKENDLKQAKLKLKNVEIQINSLRTQYPKQAIDPKITQEISRQQNILFSLSKVLHLLSDKDSDQSQGFSLYFSALARQSIADVWLSNVNIYAEEQKLTLTGSTFYPGKIPVFFQNLQQEVIFQGKHFAKLIMSQTEENKSQIDFTISTSPEDVETSEQQTHD